MRIFKGLENVHAIIDQHEAEWRRENGEEPLQPRPRVRARAKNIERQVVERYSESLTPSAAENEKSRFDPERFSKSAEPQVKAINVIEQGDNEHHSWLYKEVMKAINDAAEGNKNVKIVAVFVPVIQNSKEFDNFPADETVTVSSAVNEDDVHDVKPLIPDSEPEVNNADVVEDLIPPTHVEADSELTEAFQTIEENLDLDANSEAGPMIEAPDEDESEEPESVAAVEAPQESEPEAANPVEPVEASEPELEADPESESESELEESAEPLAFDEIKEDNSDLEESGELEEPVILPEVHEIESESEAAEEVEEVEELSSELPDIPELDSNPDDEATI